MAIATIEELTPQQAVWLNLIVDRFRNDPEVVNEVFTFAQDGKYDYNAWIQGEGLRLTADLNDASGTRTMRGHGVVLMQVRVSEEIRAQITAGVTKHRDERDANAERVAGECLDLALAKKVV